MHNSPHKCTTRPLNAQLAKQMHNPNFGNITQKTHAQLKRQMHNSQHNFTTQHSNAQLTKQMHNSNFGGRTQRTHTQLKSQMPSRNSKGTSANSYWQVFYEGILLDIPWLSWLKRFCLKLVVATALWPRPYLLGGS